MIKNQSPNPADKSYYLRPILFSLFAILISLFPIQNIYFQKIENTGGILLSKTIDLPPPPPIPKNITSIGTPFISAESVLIKDIPSGIVLYSKNENTLLPPASTTKLMTALVILDKFSLEDTMTVKTVIKEGRNMGLHEGEKLTVEALLYGTLVHSANDATYTLAENYPGGVNKFVAVMNEKVKELHLNNTYFTNPIGFDNPNHYTTAEDLAKLAIIALQNKTIVKIVSTKAITVSDVSFTYFYELKNVNELLGKVAGIAGVKTGYTQNAGEILVSEVKKNGQSVLFVILRSTDRFGETTKLIDWVFTNFQWFPVDNLIPTNQD